MDWVSLAFLGGSFLQDKGGTAAFKKDYKENKNIDNSDIPLLNDSSSTPDKDADDDDWGWNTSKQSIPKKSPSKVSSDGWDKDDWEQESWDSQSHKETSIITSTSSKSRSKPSSKLSTKTSGINSKTKSCDSDLLIDFEENNEENGGNGKVDWDSGWDDDAWEQLDTSLTGRKKD